MNYRFAAVAAPLLIGYLVAFAPEASANPMDPTELAQIAVTDTIIVDPCPTGCRCKPPPPPCGILITAGGLDYCNDPADSVWSFADPSTHQTDTNTNGYVESDVLPVPSGTGKLLALWDQYLDMPRGSGYVQFTQYRFFKNGSWSSWRNSDPGGTVRSGKDQFWARESGELVEAAQGDSLQLRYSIGCVHSLSSASSDCNPVTYGVLYDNFRVLAIRGIAPAPVFGILPVSLPQSTFVSGTMAGTGCNPGTVTAGACWPGMRGSDIGTPAAIHDNVNSPIGDSVVIAIASPLRKNGMGLNWHFGYDKSVGGGLTIARTNAAYNASLDGPRVIYRLFDPATRTWSPFDSSALDADAVSVSGADTILNGNGFRMVWPLRDKAAASLPGGFSINGHTLYSQLAFLPRGTRLQYYFKAVDILGNRLYQFRSDDAAREVEDLPTLPGSSLVAPDIIEFDVLPRIYAAGPGGTQLAGKTNTPLLSVEGAYGGWSFGVDPVVQALRALGVRCDRYRLLRGTDYGNNIGGHELSPPTFGPGTNYFPNQNEYSIKDSLAAWYRIVILSGHLRTDPWIGESDAKLLRDWWTTSSGTDGGDRCLFASGNDFFNSLLNGGSGVEEDTLASNVFGVGTVAAAWDGTLTNLTPLVDDRFSGNGPGLAPPGTFKYNADATCPVPKRFDAVFATGAVGTGASTIYPGSTQAAAVVNMQERDPIPDHDRGKTLGYGFSLEFIRTAGENLVDTRAQVLYRFLTSCRGARTFADTGTCWPCPADASKYGNWATLTGFQSGTYGPLYALQDATRALTGTGESHSPPSANYLSQNRPNPFNPSTEITYRVTRAGRVLITVFDLHGRRVRALLDRFVTEGPHEVRWDGAMDDGHHAASGVYFYQIKFGDGSASQRKMVLLR